MARAARDSEIQSSCRRKEGRHSCWAGSSLLAGSLTSSCCCKWQPVAVGNLMRQLTGNLQWQRRVERYVERKGASCIGSRARLLWCRC